MVVVLSTCKQVQDMRSSKCQGQSIEDLQCKSPMRNKRSLSNKKNLLQVYSKW